MRNRQRTRWGTIFTIAMSLLATACGAAANPPAPPPVCEQDCQDNIALRALRETMRFAYNRLLLGNPVGPQDEMSPCPLNSGKIRIFGDATSDAMLGTTEVHLTFDFQDCATRFIHVTPERNYAVTLTGAVKEDGVLVMSTGTTAIAISAESLSFKGAVYDPPVDYDQSSCKVGAMQNGNNVSGTLCDRPAGFMGF